MRSTCTSSVNKMKRRLQGPVLERLEELYVQSCKSQRKLEGFAFHYEKVGNTDDCLDNRGMRKFLTRAGRQNLSLEFICRLRSSPVPAWKWEGALEFIQNTTDYYFDFPHPDAPCERLWGFTERGEIEEAIKMIEGKQADPSMHKSHILYLASLHGYYEFVKYLLTVPGVDPSLDNPLTAACEQGHFEIVDLLLLDPRVDPSRQHSFCLLVASQEGHTKVVERLLQDHRVDPSVERNNVIQIASQCGYSEIVKLLHNDPRVDPAVDDNYCIHVAAQNGDLDMLRILADNPRVDPASDGNYCLQIAIQSGHTECVRLLLALPCIDPSAWGGVSLIMACKYGYIDVIRLLVADPRIVIASDEIRFEYPEETINVASAAANGGHFEICELLALDPKWKHDGDEDFKLFKNAVRGGSLRVLKLFLELLDTAKFFSTLIQTAAKYNCWEIAEWWLGLPFRATPDPCLKGRDLPQPTARQLVRSTYIGCREGNFEFVRLLMQTKKDIVTASGLDQQKNLAAACPTGNVKLVEYLLETLSTTRLKFRGPVKVSLETGCLAITKLLFPYTELHDFLDCIRVARTPTHALTAFSWFAWPAIAKYLWLGLSDEESILSYLPGEFKHILLESLIIAHEKELTKEITQTEM